MIERPQWVMCMGLPPFNLCLFWLHRDVRLDSAEAAFDAFDSKSNDGKIVVSVS